MINDSFGRPLRDLRISVTDRCNFRCTYCMPAEVFGESYQFLPKEEILSFEEIARLSRIFVGLGVNKLRITGGEPLLRTNLHRLIAMLSEIDESVDLTLTTNAFLLPQQAQELKDAGLQRVTISLDTLDDEIFKQMNGRGFGTQRVLLGIERAAAVGLSPIKINAVVQKGVNDHTVVDLARRFKGTGHIVRFIEYMDVGNRNGWKWDQVVPAADIVSRIDADPTLLRGLHPLPHLHRRQGLHLLIRQQWSQLEGSDAARRRRRRAAGFDLRNLGTPYRPLLRGTDRIGGPGKLPPQDRDVSDRGVASFQPSASC